MAITLSPAQSTRLRVSDDSGKPVKAFAFCPAFIRGGEEHLRGSWLRYTQDDGSSVAVEGLRFGLDDEGCTWGIVVRSVDGAVGRAFTGKVGRDGVLDVEVQ